MSKQSTQDLEQKKFIPHLVHGLHVMSMGFLLDTQTPVMWRGPILQTAIRQLFEDVMWPDLDILFVDMPPGTGDAHLTIGRMVSGIRAILVTTPQSIALQDAVRCLKTFQKMNVPVMGMVENMKSVLCAQCGSEANLFCGEEVTHLCQKENISYLGAIPFSPEIIQATNRHANFQVVMSAETRNIFDNIALKILQTAHI